MSVPVMASGLGPAGRAPFARAVWRAVSMELAATADADKAAIEGWQ